MQIMMRLRLLLLLLQLQLLLLYYVVDSALGVVLGYEYTGSN